MRSYIIKLSNLYTAYIRHSPSTANQSVLGLILVVQALTIFHEIWAKKILPHWIISQEVLPLKQFPREAPARRGT
jgi:hypothetical protein